MQKMAKKAKKTSKTHGVSTPVRSQSPGHLLRPGSPRGAAQPSPRLSQRAPRAAAVANRPSQSPHFWQPWNLGRVLVVMGNEG